MTFNKEILDALQQARDILHKMCEDTECNSCPLYRKQYTPGSYKCLLGELKNIKLVYEVEGATE